MNNNDLDDDVKNILALLQQGNAEPQPEVEKTEKKNTAKGSKAKVADNTKISNESPQKPEKKAKTTVLPNTVEAAFLSNVNEPEDKSIYNSKVLIREEIYEIFMSLKRIKKFKSVSTLIDFALEEYIKNNRDDIKKTLYSSKKTEIL